MRRFLLAAAALAVVPACGSAPTNDRRDTEAADASGVDAYAVGPSDAGDGGGGSLVDGGSPGEASPGDVAVGRATSCAGQNDMALCNVVTTPDRHYDVCVGGVCLSPGCGQESCDTPAPHFPIPPSSMHTGLQAVPGTEPVVRDLVTGLEWQACPGGLSGAACEVGAPMDLAWNQAVAYCDGLTWAGTHDWYLPDAYEAISILDFAQATGVDPTLFMKSQSTFIYWTSQIVDQQPPEALFVQYSGFNVATTTIGILPPANTAAARCVRRGSSRDAGYSGQRYAISTAVADQPVVLDRATGLQWQRCLAGDTGADCTNGTAIDLPPEQWFSHCDALSWGGFDDWHLPTYKEFFSITSYPATKSYPFDHLIDSSVFDVKDLTWLPSASGSDPATAITTFFDLDDGDKTGPSGMSFPILCVRTPAK